MGKKTRKGRSTVLFTTALCVYVYYLFVLHLSFLLVGIIRNTLNNMSGRDVDVDGDHRVDVSDVRRREMEQYDTDIGDKVNDVLEYLRMSDRDRREAFDDAVRDQIDRVKAGAVPLRPGQTAKGVTSKIVERAKSRFPPDPYAHYMKGFSESDKYVEPSDNMKHTKHDASYFWNRLNVSQLDAQALAAENTRAFFLDARGDRHAWDNFLRYMWQMADKVNMINLACWVIEKMYNQQTEMVEEEKTRREKVRKQRERRGDAPPVFEPIIEDRRDNMKPLYKNNENEDILHEAARYLSKVPTRSRDFALPVPLIPEEARTLLKYVSGPCSIKVSRVDIPAPPSKAGLQQGLAPETPLQTRQREDIFRKLNRLEDYKRIHVIPLENDIERAKAVLGAPPLEHEVYGSRSFLKELKRRDREQFNELVNLWSDAGLLTDDARRALKRNHGVLPDDYVGRISTYYFGTHPFNVDEMIDSMYAREHGAWPPDTARRHIRIRRILRGKDPDIFRKTPELLEWERRNNTEAGDPDRLIRPYTIGAYLTPKASHEAGVADDGDDDEEYQLESGVVKPKYEDPDVVDDPGAVKYGGRTFRGPPSALIYRRPEDLGDYPTYETPEMETVDPRVAIDPFDYVKVLRTHEEVRDANRDYGVPGGQIFKIGDTVWDQAEYVRAVARVDQDLLRSYNAAREEDARLAREAKIPHFPMSPVVRSPEDLLRTHTRLIKKRAREQPDVEAAQRAFREYVSVERGKPPLSMQGTATQRLRQQREADLVRELQGRRMGHQIVRGQEGPEFTPEMAEQLRKRAWELAHTPKGPVTEKRSEQAKKTQATRAKQRSETRRANMPTNGKQLQDQARAYSQAKNIPARPRIRRFPEEAIIAFEAHANAAKGATAPNKPPQTIPKGLKNTYDEAAWTDLYTLWKTWRFGRTGANPNDPKPPHIDEHGKVATKDITIFVNDEGEDEGAVEEEEGEEGEEGD